MFVICSRVAALFEPVHPPLPHRSDGQGAQRTFPTLAQNSAVAAADPTSLIRIVLQGSAMAHTEEAPSRLAMPGFGWRLTDFNIADVVSFIRSSWGNQAASVSPEEVGKVRDALVKSAKAESSRQDLKRVLSR